MSNLVPTNRNQPQQKRAHLRRQQILDTTLILLKEDGIEKFNTASISRKLGISVGSLYRYFPNKQEILRTLAQEWFQANRNTIVEAEKWPIESMGVKTFVTDFFDKAAAVYRKHKNLSVLLQTLTEVSELRELDEEFDQFIIKFQMRIFKRMGVGKSRSEQERVAQIMLDVGHYGMITMLNQGPRMGQRTLCDLQSMLTLLLENHLIND